MAIMFAPEWEINSANYFCDPKNYFWSPNYSNLNEISFRGKTLAFEANFNLHRNKKKTTQSVQQD